MTSMLLFSFFLFTTDKVPAQSDGQKNKTDGQVLMEAFTATQGDLAGTNMNFWGQIENKEYSQEHMEKVAIDIATQLEMDQQADIQTQQDKDYTQVRLTSLLEDKMLLTVIVESMKNQEGHINTYLVVDLSLGKEYQNLDGFESNIKNHFNDLGFTCENTMTIIGTFSEKMNRNKMKDTIGISFEKADGEIVEGIEEAEYNEMVSLTGYSPKIKNSLQIGGQQVNINGAMRYNEEEGKTYFWLGVPLIATEY